MFSKGGQSSCHWSLRHLNHTILLVIDRQKANIIIDKNEDLKRHQLMFLVVVAPDLR